MTEELKRKLVYEAEYYVASHRHHKIFTVDDVNNIAIGFAEKCLTEVTKELQEELTEKDKQIAELKKANEWHFVKDGLPKESGKYLVCVGGVNGVFVLDFETEYNDFGYWCLEVASDSLGVTDTVFETVTEREEDSVIAWKEIVLPKEQEK